MKATIERATLLRCLSHVQSVVERRNTIPILSNVLIEAEGEAHRGERERDRKADQHEHNQAAEHQRRHIFQWNHCTGLSYFDSMRTSPLRAAKRLISSEIPCNVSRAKPMGTTSLIG